MAVIGMWSITLFVLYDLEFNLGPVLLYAALILVQLGICGAWSILKSLKASKVKVAENFTLSDQDEIMFRCLPHGADAYRYTAVEDKVVPLSSTPIEITFNSEAVAALATSQQNKYHKQAISFSKPKIVN